MTYKFIKKQIIYLPVTPALALAIINTIGSAHYIGDIYYHKITFLNISIKYTRRL